MKKITCRLYTQNTTLFSTPALRLRYIQLSFVNGPKECLRFEFYGEKASICPPGSVRHFDMCYTSSDVDGTFEQGKKFCESGFDWGGPGSIVKPKDMVTIDFVSKIYRSK